MRTKAICAVLATLVIMGLLFYSSGAGAQVGSDGYFENLVVSPASACVGETILISGSGAPADSPVTVVFVSDLEIQTMISVQVTGTLLGVATSDSEGNWSLAATVPSEVEVLAGNVEGVETAVAPVTSGTWWISAFSSGEVMLPDLERLSDFDGDLEGYAALGQLQVSDCAVQGISSLPATGFPLAGSGLLAGAGVIILARAGIRSLRRDSRPAMASQSGGAEEEIEAE